MKKVLSPVIIASYRCYHWKLTLSIHAVAIWFFNCQYKHKSLLVTLTTDDNIIGELKLANLMIKDNCVHLWLTRSFMLQIKAGLFHIPDAIQVKIIICSTFMIYNYQKLCSTFMICYMFECYNYLFAIHVDTNEKLPVQHSEIESSGRLVI